MSQWRDRTVGITRPLAVVGLSSLTSAALYLMVGNIAAYLFIVVLLLLSLAFLIFKKINLCLNAFLALVCAVISVAVVSMLHTDIYQQLWKYDGEEFKIKGKIVEIPEANGDMTNYILKLEQIDDKKLAHRFKVRFTCKTPIKADVYDIITAEAEFFKPENIAATGFDTANYYLADKIALSAVEAEIISPYREHSNTQCIAGEKTDRDLYYYILKLRQKILTVVTDEISTDAAGMVCGIMLGDKTLLNVDVKDNFSFAGVSHLLAVSGLHLTFILSVFYWLSGKLFLHRRAVCAAGIIVILAFMAATGFPKSVIRAGVMCILTLVAEFIFDEADALNSLGAAIILILLINPLSAADTGLLLSVSATAGILLLYSPIKQAILKITKLNKTNDEDDEFKIELSKLQRFFSSFSDKIISGFAVCASVTIMSLPVISVTYGYISLVSPLANLIIVPIGELILIMGLIYLFVKSLIPVKVMSLTIAFAIEKLTDFAEFLAELFTSSEYSIFPISKETIIIFAVLSCVTGLAFLFIKSFGKRTVFTIIFSVLFVISSAFVHYKNIGKLKIYMWGTDSASCVILTKNRHSLIISFDGAFSHSVATGVIRDDTAFSLDGIYNVGTDVDDVNNIERISNRYLSGTVHSGNDIIFADDVHISFDYSGDSSSAVLKYNGFSALFTFNADGDLSERIKGSYDIIYADMNKYAVTGYIVTGHFADIVFYNDRYYDDPYFESKCDKQNYEIIDFDEKPANLICVSSDGNYSIEEWN